MELYGQLTPTIVYSAYKTRTSALNDVTCRLSGKSSKILTHVLAGCSSLVQTKYLERHNAALKVLFFEMRRQYTSSVIFGHPDVFTTYNNSNSIDDVYNN